MPIIPVNEIATSVGASTADAIWTPQQGGQVAFLGCPVFEVLLEGNRGGGKTDTLLMDYVQEVGKGWGREWKGLLLRRTYPELSDVIDKSTKWFKIMFPGAVYNQQRHEWTFVTGERLQFGFAAQPRDYYAHHGKSYTWMGWEELTTQPDESLYKQFISLIRSSCPGIPKRLRSTTNPWGPGHHWVKKRFGLPASRGRVFTDPDTGRKRVAIFCDLFMNRAMMDNDPDYVKGLMDSASSPELYAAWIKGSWDIAAGGMFSDVWRPDVHVLPGPIDIPPGWYIDRSYDDGSARPFAVQWWAESDGSELILPGGKVQRTLRGDLVLWQQWYGWNEKERDVGLGLSATEITKGIIQRELDWNVHGRVFDGPADSQIFAMTHGVSIANDLAQPVSINGKTYPGIQWQAADKGPGSRKAGWRHLRDYLKNAVPNEQKRREKPGIFVCDLCEQWINIVPSMMRDESDADEVPKTAEDHDADCTRYRCHNPPRRVVQRPAIGLY